ncbi:MAG: hypothetical protein PHH85_11090 [Candidatus Methanoperedens sp.]|nr:hypothetical protein [Candidatus Methanoperedens sp.]
MEYEFTAISNNGDIMKGKTHIEKHFAYVLTVMFTLIGITLIVLSYYIPASLTSSIIGSIGSAFLPSGIVAFIFEFYLQERWTNDLKESLKSQISVASEQLNIKRIYRNKKEWETERLDLYFNAKEVRYLAVAPGFSYLNRDMVDLVLELLQRGTSFYFLACNPENPFATQYYGYESSDSSVKNFKRDIEKSIERLKTIKEKNNGQGKIEIRIYSSSPLCYMQIIDDKLFFLPYLYGHEQQPLMIELEKGEQFEMFEKHFQKIWDKAISIDEFFEKS